VRSHHRVVWILFLPTDSSLATKAVDALWSLPDGLPIVSRKSLAEMALAMNKQQDHPQYPAYIVCVNSSVSYFLMEHTAACKTTTGLEESMQDNVAAYFATARAALSRIGPSCAPSLSTLQALVYGVSLLIWKLSSVACRVRPLMFLVCQRPRARQFRAIMAVYSCCMQYVYHARPTP
jgi:hypothetical protein